MNLQRIILAVGIIACLFILLFPPVRSPDEYYSRVKVVGGQENNGGVVGGAFVPAISISRFAAFAGVATTQERGPVRVEVDAGELLRELALVVVLSTASYLWLPTFVAAVHREFHNTGPTPPKA